MSSKCLVKNKQGKCAKNITILGRRWFQKTYGNTYHTAEVYVDGEFIGKSNRTYGYGDGYLQTAFEILQARKLTRKTHKIVKHYRNGVYDYTSDDGHQIDWSNFMEDRRNHRNKYIISVTDVERERDL